MTVEVLQRRLNSLMNSKMVSRVRNLHDILYYEELWFMAYQNIYSNKGAFTKGSDDSDTLDNFDKERVNKIIANLKDISYQCKPARRINIPKANGSTRPLSIPCGTDKLVQEACRIILEAIYEPKFSDSSHGFRPGRSCHTALQRVSEWSSTKWWIEFDIKGCFDNIDHTILIKLLEKRIDDQKFINIIRKMLKAGYLDNFQYHNTYSGTPQGGIISPLLANVYLSELDHFIDKLCEVTNDDTIKNNLNPEYIKVSNDYKHSKNRISKLEEKYNTIQNYIDKNLKNVNYDIEIYKIFNECFEFNKNKQFSMIQTRCEKLEKLTGLNRYDLYQTFKIREIKQKLIENKNLIEKSLQLRENIKSTEYNNEFERLRYVRYADDFVLGFIGTKSRASLIFEQIKIFLKDVLNLDISSEKSKIVFGIDGILYLGYNIEMPEYNGEKVTWINGTKAKRNLVRPVFKVPVEKAIKFVSKHEYGSYVENTSTHRSYLQNFDEIEMIKQYNAELRGLIQYYKHAVNCKHIIGKVQWLGHYSLLKTMCAKHHCSVAQLFKKHIIKVKKNENNSKTWHIDINGKSFDVFYIRDIKYVNMHEAKNTYFNDIIPSWQVNKRNSAVRKLIANECEICGATDVSTKIILHHPNQIRSIPKNIPEWKRVKQMRLRKTIALCHECHMKIHHP